MEKEMEGSSSFNLMKAFMVGLMVPRGMKIKANKHGINSGWFMFPFNFDPVWLEECSEFKEEETK